MPDFLEQMVRELAQMSLQQENVGIVWQQIEAMKSRDPGKMASLLDDLFVLISDTIPTPERRTDRQGFLQIREAMWKGLPDIDYVLEEEPVANDHPDPTCGAGLLEVAAPCDENLVDPFGIGQQEGRKRPEAERHEPAVVGRGAGHEPERIARIGRKVAEERHGPGRRTGTNGRRHAATVLPA